MPPLATHDRTTHWVIHSHGGFDRNNEVRADVVFIIDHSVAMSGVGASDLQRLDVGCVSLSRRHLEGQARSAWPTTMPNAQVGVCVGSKDRGTCRTCVCRAHDDRGLSGGGAGLRGLIRFCDLVFQPPLTWDAAISNAQGSPRIPDSCWLGSSNSASSQRKSHGYALATLQLSPRVPSGVSIGLSDHARCRSRRAPLGPRRIARCASPVRRRRPRPAWRHDHRLTGILPGPRGGGRLRLTLGS